MLTKIKSNGSLLDRVVLVLNNNYAPLDICNTKRAVCLWYLGKIDVIESYPEFLHSPGEALPAPSVVKLNEYIRYQSLEVILTRKNLMIRDQHTCQYCGSATGPMTLDHVLPREKGGPDTWENLVTACNYCNLRKGNRTPEQAGMKLLRPPKRPNRIHHFQKFVRQQQTAWKPYLFMGNFKSTMIDSSLLEINS